MRRILTRIVLAATLTITTGTAWTQASDYRPTAHGKFVGAEQVPSCRFRYFDGMVVFSKAEVRLEIRCAVKRWPVPGGVTEALRIARRESGLNWYAQNPTSSAAGVFQFVDGTWSSTRYRLAEFAQRQELDPSVLNARSNVILAIRSAHGAGWGPWGG